MCGTANFKLQIEEVIDKGKKQKFMDPFDL